MISGSTPEGGTKPGTVFEAVVNDDGSLDVAIIGPSTLGGVDINRVLVTADGKLAFAGSVTIDSLDVTDVNLVGTPNADGSGTSYHLIVTSDGAAKVDVNTIPPVTVQGVHSGTPTTIKTEADGTVDITGTVTTTGVGAKALTPSTIRQTGAGTVTFASSLRAYSITVLAGVPQVGGVALAEGYSESFALDWPGDSFGTIPSLVCASGDDVLVTKLG